MSPANDPCTPACLFFAGLAALAGNARQDGAAAERGEVTVEAVRGLARLETASGGRLELGAGEQRLAGASGTLELGALGEASVSWPGRASVRLIGPARIAWASAAVAGDEASAAPRTRLVCTLDEARRAAFEVREPGVEVEIDGAWTLCAARSAFLVEERPGRAREVEVQAGEDLRLVRRADPFVEPARLLAAGERTPLVARAHRGQTAREPAPPWDEVTWPFAAPVPPAAPVGSPILEPAVPSAIARLAPQGAASAASRAPAGGPPAVAAVAGEADAGTRPVPRPPDDPAPAGSSAPSTGTASAPEPSRPSVIGAAPADGPGPAPAIAPPLEPSPAPEPAATPAEPRAATRFQPADWRGLRAAQLARVGPVVLDRDSLERLVVRSDEQGRLEVSLPAAETEPAWCATQRYDFELRPGACAVFDGAGKMVARVGAMKVAAAPVSRPSPEDAGIEFFPERPSASGQGTGSVPPRK